MGYEKAFTIDPSGTGWKRWRGSFKAVLIDARALDEVMDKVKDKTNTVKTSTKNKHKTIQSHQQIQSEMSKMQKARRD